MMRASVKILWIILIVLAAHYSSFAQDKSVVPSECLSGEVRNPLVNLNLERIDKENQDVIFRLSNNSTCDILVETQGPQFVNGKLDDSLVLQNGASISVFYTTEDSRTGVKQTPLMLGRGCVIESTDALLRADHSILFRMPLDAIKKRSNIIVEFRFSTETMPMKYEAYLNVKDLSARLGR